jgi:hypothetical protein
MWAGVQVIVEIAEASGGGIIEPGETTGDCADYGDCPDYEDNRILEYAGRQRIGTHRQ